MADPTLRDVESSAQITDDTQARVEGDADVYVFGRAVPGEEPGTKSPKRAILIKGDDSETMIKFAGDDVHRLIQKLENPREAER